MYQKKQPQKTDQEWNKIRFTNSLGPQIGGLLHDSCAIVIAMGVKNRTVESVESDIKGWLDVLYDIAEAKKAELTQIKPVSDKDSKKADEDFQKKYNEQSKLEDLTYKQEAFIEDANKDLAGEKETLQEEGERLKQEGTKEKEMESREDQQQKYGPDNAPSWNDDKPEDEKL